MPNTLAYAHQGGAPPDSGTSRPRAWSDPQNPYTTAKLLIDRHAGAAEDRAAGEMAHAQAVGDAGSYASWWGIRDAIADLQECAARPAGP
jgi:hypothetical protein